MKLAVVQHATSSGAEIIFAEIDPSEFLDLELLRRPVRIPELLKQKLERL